MVYACDSCKEVRDDVIWLHSQDGAMVVSQACPNNRYCMPRGVARLSRRSSDDGRPIALDKNELKKINVTTISQPTAAGSTGGPVFR